ncbi:hypothetical protein A3E99_02760 [Candidatus Kaiserbacteria bacterium RIFCSPHIGHO2_12_FULL_54_16]|nr:MAG: hypothetical protein A3E99_02760 [Candidatus Kaiserbacteria bacterium RIFCSPHIGHO2_12_FULL_54_16]
MEAADMRRFLSTVSIALALFVVAPAAHAAECTTDGQACTLSGGGTGTCTKDETESLVCTPPVGTVINVAAAKTATDGKLGPSGSPEYTYNGIMAFIASLFAWLLGVAALTLDGAVYYTVVTMGSYVKEIVGVGIAWRVMRDIGNIFLIFGFLAIGITTILNVDWYGGGKKMLPMLLVAAVFLNFSLFISEAVIDTGNLFATQIYTQINGGKPAGDKLSPGIFTAIKQEGISNKIMDQLGLQVIYGRALDSKTAEEMFKNSALIGFMSILLFLIAAFVFFSLAFILIARFVILLFLIILAPIGFAGLAVPQMKGTADKWWHALFEQTITAPVLLLLLYIALLVITDKQFLKFGSTPDWIGFVKGDNFTGFMSMILGFLIAMGLLLAVVIISKKMSAFGAATAIKFGAAASFGASAYGASALFGGGAFLARKGLQRYAPNNRAVRAISNYALRPLEKRKFDFRSAGVGAALGAVGVSEVATPVAGSTVGRGKQGAEWFKKTGQEADRQYQQETIVPRLNAAVQRALQTGDTADYKQVSNILSSMSDKDFETSSAQRALINNPTAAAMLPQARYEKVQQSEAISDARKAEIAQARRDGDNPDNDLSRFNMNPANAYGPGHPLAGQTRGQAAINGMNTTARGRLGGGVLTEPTPPGAPPGTPPFQPRLATLNLLNGSDFDAIRRTGELIPDHREAIGRYIDDMLAHLPPHPSARQLSIRAAAAAPNFRSYYNLP